MSPDLERQYNAAIDQSLSHAQSSLGAIANRQLTKDQQGLVAQIRNIMQQAQAARSSDLPGAKSLAIKFSEALDAEYRACGVRVTAVCGADTK